MEKANSLFLLSGVKDHIVADCNVNGGVVVFFARHQHEEGYPSIRLVVSKSPSGFIISYSVSEAGRDVVQGDSDPVPSQLLPVFLSAIINDSIPS